MSNLPIITAKPERQPVARADASFPWYIGTALILAVGGGFALAILLPLAVVLEWDWGMRWRLLVQVHGHLQVIGWLGLFIVGMAYRLVPRFAGRPLRLANLTPLTLVLLLGGLLGRGAAQPWIGLPGMRALLVTATLAELVGAALFAASITATLWPVTRTMAPAPLLMLGAAGLVAQAALGVLWLSHIAGDAPVISADRNAALLAIQIYAFVLPFMLGVALRSLPVFFKYPVPTFLRTFMLVLALASGSVLYGIVPLMLDGEARTRLAGAGASLLAAALAGGTAMTGVWRRPERLRASARHGALLIRTAFAWLMLAAVLLLLSGLHAFWTGRPTQPHIADAIRHLILLGGGSTLLVGMAQLVLPWLAMRRQLRHARASIETWTLWALLTGATALRLTGAGLEGGGVGAERFWPVAAAGVLGLMAVGTFAWSVLRAARAPRPKIST